MGKSISFFSMLAIAFVSVLLFSGGDFPVYAQCGDNDPAANVVNCTADETASGISFVGLDGTVNLNEFNLTPPSGTSGISGTGTLTITGTGDITTNNAFGISFAGDVNNQVDVNVNGNSFGITSPNSIINSGDVTVNGNGFGVSAAGTVTNSGDVMLAGSGFGISSASTITNSGAITVTGNGFGVSAVGTVTNSGAVTLAGSGFGISSASTVTNSGAVTTQGLGAMGITSANNVMNSGNISTGNSAIGISASGNITNSGDINANNATAISGSNSNQTITVTAGTITGGNGVAVDAGSGNDTVIINIVATLNGTIEGGAGTDSLQLMGGTFNQAEIDAVNALVAQNCAAGCSGSVVVNGKTYTYANFEGFVNLLTLLFPDEFVGAALPATPSVICDDGVVKVFRLVNGDLEVYSGFSSNLPNGFLVGRVILTEVLATPPVLTFQDNDLGWQVVVSLSPRSMQVVDSAQTPVGNRCHF